MKVCRYNQYQIRVLNARVCVMSFTKETQHQVAATKVSCIIHTIVRQAWNQKRTKLF